MQKFPVAETWRADKKLERREEDSELITSRQVAVMKKRYVLVSLSVDW